MKSEMKHVNASADAELLCVLVQVQAGGHPSASGAGRGRVLDGGFHRGPHPHVRMEQPVAPAAERLHQLRPRHHLPV